MVGWEEHLRLDHFTLEEVGVLEANDGETIVVNLISSEIGLYQRVKWIVTLDSLSFFIVFNLNEFDETVLEHCVEQEYWAYIQHYGTLSYRRKRRAQQSLRNKPRMQRIELHSYSQRLPNSQYSNKHIFWNLPPENSIQETILFWSSLYWAISSPYAVKSLAMRIYVKGCCLALTSSLNETSSYPFYKSAKEGNSSKYISIATLQSDQNTCELTSHRYTQGRWSTQQRLLSWCFQDAK